MTTIASGPPGALADAAAAASARHLRDDAGLPRTGGPAGNAVLTAWTGLVLLVLFVAELLTLFDVRGLITWHVAIGALLVPPALLKTGVTTWRLVRYYRGNDSYHQAGPPPLLLRLLGPWWCCPPSACSPRASSWCFSASRPASTCSCHQQDSG